MNTDEVKMVSGTRWKPVYVALVFLAKPARLPCWLSEPPADEKVSGRTVLSLDKDGVLHTRGVLQFPVASLGPTEVWGLSFF